MICKYNVEIKLFKYHYKVFGVVHYKVHLWHVELCEQVQGYMYFITAQKWQKSINLFDWCIML